MYVAPRGGRITDFTSVFSWAHFYAGPSVPKLRNHHDPVADLSSYQHSEPLLKLPPSLFFPRGLATQTVSLWEIEWCFLYFCHNRASVFDHFCLKPWESELHRNQSYRDFFTIVLLFSIHGEQCGGQVHLFRKRKKKKVSEVLFPRLKVWWEHNKSLRDLVQTFLR